MKITRERFRAAVGREPQNDDLERCNCPKVGQIGHFMCGWNERLEMPVFFVGKDDDACGGTRANGRF